MASFRTKRRARRMLLPLLMTTTGVLFLAPSAAKADSGLGVVTNTPTDASTVAPGSTVSYSFTVTNAGPDPATAVVLTDTPDANTTYITNSAKVDGADVPGDENPGDPNPFVAGVSLANPIAVGTPVTFTFDATVNSPLADDTQLVNTASAVDNDDVDPPATSVVTQTVDSAPFLAASKTSLDLDGAPLELGDTIEYTVVVENQGTDTATAVTFTDPDPQNTSYVPNSAEVDAVNLNAASNPFNSYLLGDMAGSPVGGPAPSHTIKFQVTVTTSALPNGTLIVNTATASAPNNDVDASDSTSDPVTTAPGLTVVKTASPAEDVLLKPGDVVTYTMVVENAAAASENATNVDFTDATPADTSYNAGTATVDDGLGLGPVQVPDNPADPVNPFEDGHPIGVMAPGDRYTFSFQVTVNNPLDDATVITNTADVTSDQADSADTTTHTVDSAPILTLVKTSAPAETGKVTPGTTVTYSILVTNDLTATETAKNVTLQDPTPANMVYVPSSARMSGAAMAAGSNSNPLADPFPLPPLAPGESQTVTFDAKVVSPLANGTVITNLAKMTADNHMDLEDAATHTVDSAAVLKVATDSLPKPGSKVKGGQTITFDALVQNDQAATDSLKNVVVTASAPGGTTFVGGSVKVDGVTVPGSGSGSTTLAPSNPLSTGYALGTMAPGISHTISYKAKVKDSAGSITGTWTVTADGLTAVTATSTLRGPNSGGGSGDGDGDGSGSDTTDGSTTVDGAVEATSDELAFTGLELTRLLLLAMTLLLAGWTLMARGRSVQRRNATAAVHAEQSEDDATAVWDRWVGAWFYPESRR